MISPLPDIQVLDLEPDIEFMVLACDGIWNSMSSKEVIDFVRPRLLENSGNLSKICEEVRQSWRYYICSVTCSLTQLVGVDHFSVVRSLSRSEYSLRWNRLRQHDSHNSTIQRLEVFNVEEEASAGGRKQRGRGMHKEETKD